jgi:hypothetical protein
MQYDMALAISPTNANMIFTGGLVVFDLRMAELILMATPLTGRGSW